jgi:hypothetical protein
VDYSRYMGDTKEVLWTKEMFVAFCSPLKSIHVRLNTSCVPLRIFRGFSHCAMDILIYIAQSQPDFIASLGGVVGSTRHDKARNDWLD